MYPKVDDMLATLELGAAMYKRTVMPRMKGYERQETKREEERPERSGYDISQLIR